MQTHLLEIASAFGSLHTVHPSSDAQALHPDLHIKQPVVDVLDGVPVYPDLQTHAPELITALGSAQVKQLLDEVQVVHADGQE